MLSDNSWFFSSETAFILTKPELMSMDLLSQNWAKKNWGENKWKMIFVY